MSTTVMAACWPLQMPPTQKAVLISLADNANDHGECWPSLSKICERTCFGKTAVIDAIRWLESAGLVVANRDNGRHTKYLINPAGMSANLYASRTGTAAEQVRQANQSVSRTGPADGPNLSASRTGPVRQADTNRKEPSRTVRNTRGGKKTFDQWTESLGDDDAIPADDPIFEWSRKAGIPDDFLELAWLAFADRFTGNAKLYTDWRATFRNYVKSGWLGVWRVTAGGAYVLTDAGQQWAHVRDSEQRTAA